MQACAGDSHPWPSRLLKLVRLRRLKIYYTRLKDTLRVRPRPSARCVVAAHQTLRFGNSSGRFIPFGGPFLKFCLSFLCVDAASPSPLPFDVEVFATGFRPSPRPRPLFFCAKNRRVHVRGRKCCYCDIFTLRTGTRTRTGSLKLTSGGKCGFSSVLRRFDILQA